MAFNATGTNLSFSTYLHFMRIIVNRITKHAPLEVFEANRFSYKANARLLLIPLIQMIATRFTWCTLRLRRKIGIRTSLSSNKERINRPELNFCR